MDTDKEKVLPASGPSPLPSPPLSPQKPETEKQTVKRKKSKKHECVVTPLVGTGVEG